MKSKLLLTTFAIFIAIAFQLKAQTPGWTPSNTAFPGVTAGLADGIFNISIPASQIVWAIDYDGTGNATPLTDWTKTTDGGTTWTGGSISDATGLEGSNIFGLDGNTAVYMFWNPANLAPAVYRTTDGGTTWTQIANVFTANEEFPDWGTFFDNNNGVMLGDPDPVANDGVFEIYTTSDGGATWTKVPSSNIEDPLAGETGLNAQSFCKANGTTVWAGTTSGRVIKSTDMGHTWRPYSPPGIGGTAGVFIGNLAAKDSSTCVIGVQDNAGNDLGVYETTDGGATWSNIVTAGGNTGFLTVRSSIAFVPGTDSVFEISGADFNTADGSLFTKDWVNYTVIDTGLQHTTTLFASPTEGYSGNFQENIGDTLVGGGMWLLTGSFPTSVQSPVFDASSMNLYPNPAKNSFTFHLNMRKPADLKVSLMNSQGQVVATYAKSQAYGMVLHNFETQNLARGLYFLQVQVGKFQSSKKIIIQ